MASTVNAIIEKFTSPKPTGANEEAKTPAPLATKAAEAYEQSAAPKEEPTAPGQEAPNEESTETALTTADEKTAVKEERRNEPVDPDNAEAAVKRNVTGTVSFFSLVNGYGFIKRKDTGGDVFVHASDIIQRSPRETHLLTQDEECEFTVVANHKGPKAVAVTAIGGEWYTGERVITGRLPMRLRRAFGRRTPRFNRESNPSKPDAAKAEGAKPEGAKPEGAERPRAERSRPLRARRSPKKDVSAESVNDDNQQQQALKTADDEQTKAPQDKKERRPRRQSNKKPRNKSVSGEGDAKTAGDEAKPTANPTDETSVEVPVNEEVESHA